MRFERVWSGSSFKARLFAFSAGGVETKNPSKGRKKRNCTACTWSSKPRRVGKKKMVPKKDPKGEKQQTTPDTEHLVFFNPFFFGVKILSRFSGGKPVSRCGRSWGFQWCRYAKHNAILCCAKPPILHNAKRCDCNASWIWPCGSFRRTSAERLERLSMRNLCLVPLAHGFCAQMVRFWS